MGTKRKSPHAIDEYRAAMTYAATLAELVAKHLGADVSESDNIM